ncbi:hypothetical protein [Anaeromyxobacter diazotrophicus]|uniref:Uncharacterized protein n=1 Tax=Anaeromyxobacter diazotrophicus TaxID=2590199 RepID=A0A7I9VLH2_9BACT|nr:hypothetical protein [Anaeromyxobacter diazotrophicus]GEJ56980.1 hypothetical protein AMYX_17210 [Anaeromyxobacter diazotrophicus]
MAALLALAACSGSKELTCAADQGICANACTSLLTDAQNCGACGKTCGAGQGCSAGACVDCAANPAACTAEVAVACFATNDVRFVGQDLTQVGPSLPVGNGPSAFARVGGTFYVADDLSSDVTPFTLAPLAAGSPVNVTFTGSYGDLSSLSEHGGLLWASNDQASTLVVIDPSAARVVAEVKLAQTQGERVNPKDIAFVGTKAYLAMYDAGAVGVLDVSTPTSPKVLKRIDVAKYATAPATASPSRVVVASGKVYVTLADIQDTSYAMVAGAHGKLVEIDPSTDAVVGDTALDLGPDCLDAGALVLSGTTLWVGCGYDDFATGVHGGGLLPVAVGGAKPQPGAIVKTASAIYAVTLCGGNGYAGATESGKVLRFDVMTGAVTAIADVCPFNGYATVADVACVR